MRFKFVPLFIILISTLQAFAQQPDKVDEFILNEMQRQKIPGLALAVVKDGKVVKAKGYGFANVEHQVPVKPETVFQSGSTGKQFTATAVMMLAEEGKLSLDDKISKYFTDAPDAWKEITVRNLLSHTSGTTDYPKDFSYVYDPIVALKSGMARRPARSHRRAPRLP